MKKIIIAMAAIAAALTMASCNKEQPVSPYENPTVGKSIITASIENGLTKAHLDANGDDTDGYKVFWSEGDDLIVGGGLDEYGNYLNWVAEYKLEDSSAGSSKGTFSWQDGNKFISIDEICKEPSFEAGNMYMAVHPFDLIDMNTSAFTWRTEQTYNGTTGYIPMIAAAEGTEDGTADFKFTNLGGLLRLTVKGTATIKSITVKAKEPMSGELDCFAMDEEGNIVALMGDDDGYETYNYINLDCGESGVALSSTGTDFYISMPCHYSVEEDDISLGGYSEVSITLTDTKDNICEKKLSSNKQLVIERSKITTATFTASEFKAPVPEGALPGMFSIGENKHVQFSKGNLYCRRSGSEGSYSYSFAFEDNQWEYHTRYGVKHTTNSQSTVVDPVNDNVPGLKYEENASGLFQWISSFAPGVTDDIRASYGAFSELSEEASSPTSSNVSLEFGNAVGTNWSALSYEEWAYLIGYDFSEWGVTEDAGRPNAKKLYMSEVMVNGVCGSVIAPDDWNITDYPLQSSYDASTWHEMESLGLVFLPYAGCYWPADEKYAEMVSYFGDNGYYSTNSFDPEYNEAWYLGVYYGGYDGYLGTGTCDYGRSVRLAYRVD